MRAPALWLSNSARLLRLCGFLRRCRSPRCWLCASLTHGDTILQYSQMLPSFLLCAGVIWCWAGCVALNSEVVINGLRWEQDRRKTLQLAEENEFAEELWTKAETKLSECSKFDVSEWWEYCRSLPHSEDRALPAGSLSLRFLRCARHHCGHQGSAEGCFHN